MKSTYPLHLAFMLTGARKFGEVLSFYENILPEQLSTMRRTDGTIGFILDDVTYSGKHDKDTDTFIFDLAGEEYELDLTNPAGDCYMDMEFGLAVLLLLNERYSGFTLVEWFHHLTGEKIEREDDSLIPVYFSLLILSIHLANSGETGIDFQLADGSGVEMYGVDKEGFYACSKIFPVPRNVLLVKCPRFFPSVEQIGDHSGDEECFLVDYEQFPIGEVPL